MSHPARRQSVKLDIAPVIILTAAAICSSMLQPSRAGAVEQIRRLPPITEGAVARAFVSPAFADESESASEEHQAPDRGQWAWQILPHGLIYRSYLAGVKEPRLSITWNHEANDGWKWDLTAGARVGLIRLGTFDHGNPEGWQLDVEGAAFPRLDPENNLDLEATDFRVGVPLTYGTGRHQYKLAFYHLSSHLGDEYIIRNGAGGRINFSRDVIVLGRSLMLSDSLRLYAEAGFAVYADVCKTWEFQFGIDYSPARRFGFRGAPYAAVNAHIREEVDFGGNLVVQAGWQWRGRCSGQRMRAGVQYFNGKHEKYEFFNTSEQKIGLGLWYDF